MKKSFFSMAAICSLLAGCGGSSSDVNPYSVVPTYLSGGVVTLAVDSSTDDLLTGGNFDAASGAFGTPTFADPVNPTSDELRRFNLGANYKSMMDPLTPGGWGEQWGPTVVNHVAGAFSGSVAGDEYQAIVDDGSGQQNVKLVAMIPENFDVDNPCIIAGPSSGSRGVYGAAGSAGDAALKRGCAVAYTDKGTGDGVHLLGSNEVLNLDGQLVDATAAGTTSAFTAQFAAGYATTVDSRTATTKHAHSQQNPEKDWGQNTLQSIEFALYALNQQFPDADFTSTNTTVIAASWSNGGRAVLMAAEQDTTGLIDGVVAVEPSTAMDMSEFTIVQGTSSWGPASVGWSLYDHHAFGAIYQTCANNLPANDAADLGNFYKSPERCAQLRTLGLLTSDTLAEQAQEAQDILNTTGGFLPEQNLGIPAFSSMYSEITATYGNSYGRFGIADQLCGVSFASYNKGTKVFEQLSAEDKAMRFVGQNMVAGGGRWIQPVNLNAVDPYAATAFASTSDNNLEGDLCFFAMSNYGNAKLQELGILATYQQNGDFARVQAGIAEAAMTGNLQGKPTIIMHGRADQVVAPNHGARAYYARNRQVDNRADVVLWEIENGHHLEMFGYLLAPNLGFYSGNYQHRYAYNHPYFEKAIDQMFDHLKTGAALSPSQVVHTVSQLESGETKITAGMFGPVQTQPGADAITWSNNTLMIPQ